MGFVLRMSPCCSPNADVLGEAHFSEALAVNQRWDVRPDVCLCLLSQRLRRRETGFIGML